MKTAPPKKEEVRDRIVAAAGAVFGEQGFRGTTIRQITARAGVNVAAVNYYFRDKAELYLRVLREAKSCTGRISLQDLPGTPEERLETFIQRFVGHLLHPERPAWHGRVLALEMSNPTPALDLIVQELSGPLYRDVRSLLGEAVEGKASEIELDLLAASVFGQCIFYSCARPMVERLSLKLMAAPDRIERIAAHIYAFSIAGVRDLRRRQAALPVSSRSKPAASPHPVSP